MANLNLGTRVPHTRASRNRGISLLFVVLVGSILLVTSVAAGGLALKLIQSAAVRSGSVRAQYIAEAAFNCVTHWVQQDNGVNTYFSGDNPANLPQCSGQKDIEVTYKGEQSGVSMSYSFQLNIDGNSVTVQVKRDLGIPYFRGTVLVLGHDETDTTRELEKLQEYFFEWPSVVPGDIMFVLDRSGSIDGDRNLSCGSNPPDEWCQLKMGVTDAVNNLLRVGSEAQVGLVSYGTGIGDVGTMPEVPLTNNKALLISGSVVKINTPDATLNNTNTSLGLAVAGAALMGKAYPNNGTFEQLVATNGLFSSLADLNTGDRDDKRYPDYIILVTDGQPNAIIADANGGPYKDCFAVDTDADGIFEECQIFNKTSLYNPGDAMVFPTISATIGYEPNPSSDLIADSEFSKCFVQGTTEPESTRGYENNDAPHQAMCNAEMIAEKLKAQGITIGVIGVGMEDSSIVEGEEWLKNSIASKNTKGEALYVSVDTFSDFEEGLTMLVTEKLELYKFR